MKPATILLAPLALVGASAVVSDPPERDYDAHVRSLEERAPDGFHIVVEEPFVVIGDEPASKVEQRARGTVRWITDHLEKEYFAKDPREIVDVWLFKDRASYRKHTLELFGDEPGTPFGYYSSVHGALIMNIATGGGTLCHEIVHPFMETNFPECPAWFNEGLASLYEQCGERKGKLVGRTNWRLAGLQEAIRTDELPSFATLTATTEREFYHEDPGSNYAQARYLCFYLQEEGLLGKYYRAFHANHEKDPSGYQTLREVLGDPDMDRFQADWEKYVLRLRFPERGR